MARMVRRTLPPINSIKHYVGQPKASIVLGTSLTLEIVDVVPAPVSSQREKVNEGSVIKAVHFEYWVQLNGVSGNVGTFVMTIEKAPSGVIDPTFADMLNLGGYDNKKNILYTTEGLIGNKTDGPAIPVIRDWLKIPKGKQRMGLKDRLLVTFATVDVAMNICGVAIYKEYV